MKKLITAIAIFGFIFTTNAFAQQPMLNPDQLPNQITQYIQKHFPDSQIVAAQKEDEIFSPVEYEVWLNNGTQIDFEKTTMVNIESNAKLPASVIPNNIAEYVNSNFSSTFIVSFELDNGKQGIELNNGMELIFDDQGNFLGMDD